jgi:hypothetical protein
LIESQEEGRRKAGREHKPCHGDIGNEETAVGEFGNPLTQSLKKREERGT